VPARPALWGRRKRNETASYKGPHNENFHTYRRGLVGIGLLAALGSGAYAVAQPAPPPSDGPSARLVEDREALRQEHMARRAEMRERYEEGREARFEGRITYLRTRLEITDAQMPLWEDFVETLRANMEARVAARPEPPGPDATPPTALERLEQEQARHAARSEQLSATAATLTPLYNSFSDEQKQTADRILRRFNGAEIAMRDDRPGRAEGRREWRGVRPGPRGGPRFGRPGYGGPHFGQQEVEVSPEPEAPAQEL
jgi:hypothetical protein